MRNPNPLLTPGAIALALLVGGCEASRSPSPGGARPSVTVEAEPEWVALAAPADVERIKGLAAAWSEALSETRRSFAREVAAEGPLLDPAAALPRPAPTPGSYKCRLIKLGAQKRGARAFSAYKPFFCYVGVEGEILALTKQTGTERPGGYLYEDVRPSRLIFLGSVALGQENELPAYGEKGSRDLAGVLERVAPFRWRLVIPRPRQDSKLDVLELIPSPAQPDE